MLPLGVGERRALLVGGDLVVVAGVTAVALRLGAIRSGWAWTTSLLWAHLSWFAVLMFLWVVLAWANGLYDLRRAPDRWEAAVLSFKVALQILVVWAIAYFVPPPWTLVRHVVVFFTAGVVIAIPIWRQAYAAVFSQPAFRRRVLLVGAGRAGRTMLANIRSAAPHDFEVLGFVDDDPALKDAEVDGVKVIADRSDLVPVAQQLGVSELVLSITSGVHGEMVNALMDAREQGIDVVPMPVLYESITGRVPVEHVGDHWAVALPLAPPVARGLYPMAKRVIDVVFAVVGIAFLSVLLLVVAPLVALTSSGPVFYRQRRVGRGGRTFTLLKLRTMVVDAEPEGPVWAEPDDPRVTRVGRWLRRTRLDELPQAANILRGDMSLVGPRPERPEFVAELARRIPFYRARHAVRPGLTGWATIHQGYASSAEDALLKLQRDLYYIKHQSLMLDAYILLRTLTTILRLGGR
jgi:exopolysaccharide biosynthesis polyprenyl glycosylphosphotransferase